MHSLKYFSLLLIIINFLFFPVKSDTLFKDGKKIFLKKGRCVSCHTLDDAGSDGVIGPNLDLLELNKISIISAVTNGVGSMKGYKDKLTEGEMLAVSHYVFKSTN